MTSSRVERPTDPVVHRPQSFEVQHLDWDTAFFGKRMGSIAALGTSRDVEPISLQRDMQRVLASARANGFAHLIFRAAVDDSAAIWAAESAGLKLVDVGIDSTFNLARTGIPRAPDGTVTIRPARPDDVAGLSQLAAEAFTLSRFSADPFFSVEQVKEFHRTWTRNLCNGLARAVLVAEIDGALAGFISCAMPGTDGRIPLIGVDARFRGQQVGQTLVASALRWFGDAGCRVVHVKTQAHNYRALALYHRVGFVVTKSELTFSIALNAAA